ncbi:Magnesium transport protein CorA [Pseudomonas fluorescens]|uniref:Magnesium transport protein CorA n=1 Tax=Pseudomonas fluorescens TaxID=294 RepID=A0A5E6URB2_PSEFL|nr:CorA family divalent cation transporter [Pseudomonas fluorescens]VVN05564.1 Magnesium transport protein CorA [Pseudomonas fluorescens]
MTLKPRPGAQRLTTHDSKPPAHDWLRISTAAPGKLDALKRTLGIDIVRTLQSNLNQDGEFTFFPITFLSVDQGRKKGSRVVFVLGRDTLVSLEPSPAPQPLEAALARLQGDAGAVSALASFAVVLQAINDATDELLDSLNDELGKVLVQTNSVLNSLEARDRDFGVSDVVSAQLDLGQVEELLSDCIESQLQLALAARHTLARLPVDQEHLRARFRTLIDDIEAVEEHVSFVHDRVRLLQTTNNMALNVKQNQIVKVFSVVTAVFLPAMLISTYYSMNVVNMPILEWQYGEPMIIALTAGLALLPLLYVKHRGWLR